MDWEDALQEAGFRRILPEGKYSNLTVCYVPPTTRPGSTSRAICHPIPKANGRKRCEEEPNSSLCLSELEITEPERLVKRARSHMEGEGPSGSGKVLSEHPLEYKEDEEESEGKAYLSNSEEEGMEGRFGYDPCFVCGRLVPCTQGIPECFYCERERKEAYYAAAMQERDAEYDWFFNPCPETPIFCGDDF